jgi:hypothetical protein
MPNEFGSFEGNLHKVFCVWLGNLRLRSWSTCTIGVASDAEDQDATHTVTVTIPTNTTVKNTRSACIPLILRQ